MNLERILEEKNITVEDLSKGTDIPEETINEIITGDDGLLSEIIKISVFLEVGMDDLCETKPSKTSRPHQAMENLAKMYNKGWKISIFKDDTGEGRVQIFKTVTLGSQKLDELLLELSGTNNIVELFFQSPKFLERKIKESELALKRVYTL